MTDEQEKKQKIAAHVANIKFHDGPIMLPKGMKTEDAIQILMRKAKYDEEEVRLTETVPVFVWDGALALRKALTQKFGLALQEAQKFQFFGQEIKVPPMSIQIEVDVDKTEPVPWGQFMLPGIEGHVTTAVDKSDDGRFQFRMQAQVKHKDEDTIRDLFALVRQIAMEKSIYSGKAIEIRFNDQDGEPLEMPSPKFMRVTEVEVVFSAQIEASVGKNILAPIRFTKDVQKTGAPLKRGILLAGPYGTGKTLLSHRVAAECVKHGWTFIYCRKIEELPQVSRFAQGFQPAVVFGEDVDRVAGQERTDAVNEVLNTLDGIQSKHDKIMTILTTNHAEYINEAMRRPGRLDRIMKIDPPDAEAAIRLVRLYGTKLINSDVKLDEVGKELAGCIPAVIREVVEGAKLAAIWRAGGSATDITAQDLLVAAREVKMEQTLFRPEPPDEHPAVAFVKNIAETTTRDIVKLAEKGAEKAIEARFGKDE